MRFVTGAQGAIRQPMMPGFKNMQVKARPILRKRGCKQQAILHVHTFYHPPCAIKTQAA